jgi:RNA polymerase sigma factor (sigma-70 family)
MPWSWPTSEDGWASRRPVDEPGIILSEAILELVGAWCIQEVVMADGNRTDAEVIEAAETTPEVFGELFERHFDAVYRFCERRIGRAAAEDLAGETFRRAFEFRSRYDREQDNARPWLYGIAMNLIRVELRSHTIQDRAYTKLEALTGISGSDDISKFVTASAAREQLAAVARLLITLPEDDVEILLLHVWDELSYSEVSSSLGIPVGTVRSRLSRLRRRLGALMSQTNLHPDQRAATRRTV